MLDAPIRKLIEPPLDRAGSVLARFGVCADWVTWSGFVLGLCAVLAIAAGAYWVGLGFVVLNRLFDGLDGAVARQRGTSESGAFLEVVLQSIVTAAIPFAFALARPAEALAATFLILSFVASGTALLAYAAFAGQRGVANDPGRKTAGLIGSSETFLAFALACVFPSCFSLIAYIFGTLCFITCGAQVAAVLANFRNT